IPASLARESAADGVWRRLVTDPLSGTLLDHGRTTYHPPAGLADHVRARDVHCRVPGCRKRAADAELDHVLAWSDGGTTSEPNLAATCTHHHRVKTYAGWRVHAHPDGGLTWITPTGHRHSTETHDYRPEPVCTVPPPVFEPSPPAPDGVDPDPPPF
ncbi:MAG TPA: HNH endonuclease signature motif containing protein, partial [Pseudonocardia sp.]|nr:HNH endonuclease signature motif containing protein [Pseudonocardia sp.]